MYFDRQRSSITGDKARQTIPYTRVCIHVHLLLYPVGYVYLIIVAYTIFSVI